MSTSFREEFSFLSSTYTKQLNDKFRANRKTINEVMSDKDISLYKYENILNYRKNRIGIIVSAMNYDFNRKFNLLKSLVHMTMNRLFRSRNRLCELVVYDFMNRYYESVIARLKLV